MIIQITRKHRRYFMIVLAVLATGACYWCFFGFPKGLPALTLDETSDEESMREESEAAPAESEEENESSEPKLLAVHVSGAVAEPDHVYYLPEGARVEDAILAAGGALSEGDLSRLNLAGLLQDGQKLYVPFEGEDVVVQEEMTEQDTLSERETPEEGRLTNINFATKIELTALPGIGEAYAERIIEYRTVNGPFQSIEEIKNVKGIGDAIFAKIKDSITV